MTPTFKTDAVKVSDLGCEAKLDVNYKLIDRLGRETSDTITFSEPFQGRFEKAEENAKQACAIQAWQWAKFERLCGYEVSAWDDAGNTY